MTFEELIDDLLTAHFRGKYVNGKRVLSAFLYTNGYDDSSSDVTLIVGGEERYVEFPLGRDIPDELMASSPVPEPQPSTPE